MKKILAFFLIVALALCFVGCGATRPGDPDYEDAAALEASLNAGTDVTGKVVQFTVSEVIPDSAFGYNLQTGEHLNFCSASNPNVAAGDTVTVEIKEVTSSLGSYIITYTLLKQ